MDRIKSSNILFIGLCLFFPVIMLKGQQPVPFRQDRALLKLIDSNLQRSVANYTYLMKQLPADRFPVTVDPKANSIRTSGSEPWVGGFYPGGLLYLYEATHDSSLYHESLRKLNVLEKEKFNKTTHDLGFMMYCSFGNANRIAHDPKYDDIIVTSARSLASRFNEKVGCIRSWDSDAARFMVIIDNMVNLELLFAATRLTGDSSFYKIAVAHADATMQHHFRKDFSSYHLVIYDPSTGAVLKKQTVQGAADGSSWARGQSWGLYGYTVMYRETGDKKYLMQASRIADHMLRHLPADHVFYWDFNAPGIPDTYRDASATAITCAALLELAGYVQHRSGKKYFFAAENMLRTLSGPAYFSSAEESFGFLLKHGVGNFPRNSDIDVPLIYSDYYYIEAMMRYRRSGKK